MRQYFQQWCAKEVNKMYQRNGTSECIKPIDLRLSLLKPQGFKWLVEACSHIGIPNCMQTDFVK